MTPNLSTNTREHSSRNMFARSDQPAKWTYHYLHSRAESRRSLALLVGRFPFRPASTLCCCNPSPGSGRHGSSSARPSLQGSASLVTETVECGQRSVDLLDGPLCTIAFRSQVCDYCAQVNHGSPCEGILAADNHGWLVCYSLAFGDPSQRRAAQSVHGALWTHIGVENKGPHPRCSRPIISDGSCYATIHLSLAER